MKRYIGLSGKTENFVYVEDTSVPASRYGRKPLPSHAVVGGGSNPAPRDWGYASACAAQLALDLIWDATDGDSAQAWEHCVQLEYGIVVHKLKRGDDWELTQDEILEFLAKYDDIPF